MTPDEHYAEAGKILERYTAAGGASRGYMTTPPLLTEALVHATLATAPGHRYLPDGSVIASAPAGATPPRAPSCATACTEESPAMGNYVTRALTQALANARAALDGDSGDAEHDTLHEVAGTIESLLARQPYAREDVERAWNAAVSLIAEDDGIYLSDRDNDLVNLVLNATGSLLDDPDMSLDDVIRANWQAEDDGEDITMTVREWLA